MYQIVFELWYVVLKECAEFSELPASCRVDLLVWYNIAGADEEDKALLLDLYLQGKFRAWDCPGCGDRVFRGSPASYDRFQGVLNQDLSSFPGDNAIYTEEYLNSLCDSCR